MAGDSASPVGTMIQSGALQCSPQALKRPESLHGPCLPPGLFILAPQHQAGRTSLKECPHVATKSVTAGWGLLMD